VVSKNEYGFFESSVSMITVLDEANQNSDHFNSIPASISEKASYNSLSKNS
jgi:hypothetical protein